MNKLRMEINMRNYEVQVTGGRDGDYYNLEIYDTWNARMVYHEELILDEAETLTEAIVEIVTEYTGD